MFSDLNDDCKREPNTDDYYLSCRTGSQTIELKSRSNSIAIDTSVDYEARKLICDEIWSSRNHDHFQRARGIILKFIRYYS